MDGTGYSLETAIWSFDVDGANGLFGNQEMCFEGFERRVQDGSAMDTTGTSGTAATGAIAWFG